MIEQEQPTIIDGKSIISVLNEQNKVQRLGLLFHGSPAPLSELVPQVVNWRRDGVLYPDSDTPVVCAADDALVPVFMSLAPRTGAPFGYQGNADGGTNFYLHSTIQEGFSLSKGYIAVVDAKGFDIFDGRVPEGWPGKVVRRVPERRTSNRTIPLFNVKVDYRDFSELIAAQPQSKVLPYP